MYKIFVNDKPIVLTTKVEQEIHFKNYLLDTVHLGKVIKALNTSSLKEARLIHKDENKLLKKFLKKLPNVVAGGGKVFNDQGDILFIYRNDKWDLPKGKIEGNESIEKTAIREVTEETGVNGLEIIKPLETTYHIFKRNGRHRIKITYWFEMKTSFSGNFYAQEDEGITKVAWLNKEETTEALQNSYANIRGLI
ncbi:MAG: NUDIX domain-containing protein [Flavobacteriales bacterium]|nr:NUDIX domain-containing protein [Flavobacteriia bacterium]NCP05494.1 NUDIX domain-containing protein [Flavobacteriales bacterium]PIV92413.1 MAG: NUDIX hydrolase [Flavobacteriaceae bacterium CG17_big_fil_post_rev_8_21_14_2_50_33_15]PIY11811.1 MAG: NUDIX hydrolase [Flavobacteriaceae bacterium CG_4_10_14_3_um_filter_33_47]PJB16744.1 MAG: NUDIX hydrolase [Flavobacteriaceae bacterium CG_4_9_14_3_um_filter_33_16]